MSTPGFPKEGTGGRPLAKKPSTWIIVLVVAVVLAIPALADGKYLLAGSDINTCTSVPQRFGIHSVQDLVKRTFKDV